MSTRLQIACHRRLSARPDPGDVTRVTVAWRRTAPATTASVASGRGYRAGKCSRPPARRGYRSVDGDPPCCCGLTCTGIKVEELFAAGDRVVVYFTQHLRHDATGTAATITGMKMYRLAGGKIVEFWDRSVRAHAPATSGTERGSSSDRNQVQSARSPAC